MKKMFIKTATLLASVLAAGQLWAAGATAPLDPFPKAKLNDMAALQNGAKLFINYCLNCHSASAIRYNRLQDLGLTEQQIKENLLFTSDKVGDLMTVTMKPADAKQWFGVLPPDLSLTARSRATYTTSGPDWVYTYLRTFYRDNERPTGWNNLVYENVGMPHILWELQGGRTVEKEQTKKTSDEKTGKEVWKKVLTSIDEYGLRTVKEELLPAGYYHETTHVKWNAVNPAKAKAYDDQIADLVAYMTWMAEPYAKTRVQLGVWVLIFLFVFTIFAWGLNRAYWKDIQ
jgi:ubiquinol-cytochrome c reductase cytochrome c1 subunit